MVKQYLDHSREILTNRYSTFKEGSKGAGLISLNGSQNEYDLREGFPLLTTKKMFTKGVAGELIWFFSGDTNIKSLEDNNVSIWRLDVFQHHLPAMIEEGIFPAHIGGEEGKYTPEWEKAIEEFGGMMRENNEFAQKWGDAGRIYGAQWRQWKHYDEETGEVVTIDQLGEIIQKMRDKPFSKKYIVSAWNPGDNINVSLPPCHVLYHLNVNQEEGSNIPSLDLQMFQRSCDQFLGVPFNIASYSMLTQIIAQQLELEPRRFIHSFGDAHFYTGLGERTQWYRENFGELRNRIRNVSDREEYSEVLKWVNKRVPQVEQEYDHVTAILEQFAREPIPLPKLHITKGKSIDELTIEDFTLEGYEHHSLIKRKRHV